MKRTLSSVVLYLSLAGVAHASAILTLDSAAISGSPGSTIGWGFTLSNTVDFAVITSSNFCLGSTGVSNACTLSTLGTYSDYIASNFTIAGPSPESTTVSEHFNESAMSGLGSFAIGASGVNGSRDTGQVVVTYDLYSVDPLDPTFNPRTDLISAGNYLVDAASVTVSSATAVPEPVYTAILAVFLAALLLNFLRRAPVLRRFLSIRLLLVLCLLIPLQSTFAQFDRTRARGGVKDVPYVYNGQQFVFRTINGSVFYVLQGQTIVLMNLNGSVMPYPNVDPHVTATAEDALKAYQGGKPSGSVTAAAASSGSGKPLTIDGVIMMLDAGVPEDVILTKIRSAPNSLDPSPEDLVRLKKAKASDAVMKAMMEPKTASAAPPADSSQPPSVANPRADAEPGPQPSRPQITAPEGTEQKKEGFFGKIKSSVSDEIHGNTVIDKIGLRDILPQYDPNKPLSEQWPHVAITVLYAPTGWMEPYMTDQNVHSNSIFPPCFKLQATIWNDPQHVRKTNVFEWCSNKDERMTQLPMNYLFSMEKPFMGRTDLTGITRTEGPEPPDSLLPNDRQTMDMEARGSSRHQAIDLNLDQTTRFAMMFANVRADLGETLTATGDYRVWVVSIKKAAGPPLFR